MKNSVIVLMMLFSLFVNSHASESFHLTTTIIQNNKAIGAPELVLPEAEEGVMEVMGAEGHALYSLTATVVSKKENTVLVKIILKLSKNKSLVTVGEPEFFLNNGESGVMVIDHPILGKIELKVNVQNHG